MGRAYVLRPAPIQATLATLTTRVCALDTLIRLIAEYGLLAVFVNILVQQLGAPLPGYPLLLVTGALAARGELDVLALLGTAVGMSVAMVLVSIARSGGGITISMGAGQGDFRMMPTLLPIVPVIVVVATCAGSVLAALSPALRAARMRPVEALSST